MAKLTIITDHAGSIIATAQAAKGSKDAPAYVPVRPLEGQQAHEMDVPDNLAALDSVNKLHSTHRVEMKSGKATLVQR